MIDANSLFNNVMKANPDMEKDPTAAPVINAIRSGNTQAGEAMANMILQKVGMTREQAMQRAEQFFNMR